MAKRKGKKKRSTAHLKKYQFKSKKKSRKRSKGMAKKRRSRKGARRTRSRSVSRRRRSGGGGGGGGGRGFGALKSDATELLIGGLYGVAEAKAKADQTFILNKIPKPVTALGYTGNVAAALYLATYLTPNPYVRKAARVVATIAAYKLGKNGGSFTTSTSDSIGGDGDDDMGDENIIDANAMGALDAEGVQVLSSRASSAYDRREGVPYDDVVEQAGSRV